MTSRAGAAPRAPGEPPPSRTGRGEPRRLVLVGAIAFVVAAVVLVLAAPLLVPSAPVQPRHAVAEAARPHPSGDGSFVATLDVRDAEAWVPYDLLEGRRAASDGSAHLSVQRHVIRAPGGAADLGDLDFATAEVARGQAWASDERISGVLQSPAFVKWYDYGYWTHVLASRRKVQAVRTGPDSAAIVTIESYYCEPAGSGCLTLRWRLVDVPTE